MCIMYVESACPKSCVTEKFPGYAYTVAMKLGETGIGLQYFTSSVLLQARMNTYVHVNSWGWLGMSFRLNST